MGEPSGGGPTEKLSRCPPVLRGYLRHRTPNHVRSVPLLVVLVADARIVEAMKRDVGAELEVEITAPTTLEFQIAVAPHPQYSGV